MYAGSIVEKGKTKEIVNRPLHPYTWGLIRSIPEISKKGELYTIPGQVPDDISKVIGEPFAPRNEYALEIDFQLKAPSYMASNTHEVWSWLYDDNAPDFTPPKLIAKKWRSYRGDK
jgi:oligopeptide/dipeptide ABC transporter ATP-binding protein